ncbi:cupin domain-containing protein [Paraburkholderia kururiensis]|uniref:cupin domain-containing protein n=1 Tax=Paraburkholderia kururiensis TaxID=984307 RepID=UPI0005AAC4C8|nr:AraC family transcriptional regulator [Paraburkholderia kururiensis]
MELLDRLLSLMPVAGRLDVRCHFGSPWRLDEPRAGEWEIRYHVLLRGEAIVEIPGAPRGESAVRMKAGDIVLFPSGSAHTVHDGSGKRARAVREEQVDGLTIATNGSTRGGADLLCGWFVLPVVPQQLLRDHLPQRLIVSSMTASIGQDERDTAFAASRLARLVELMREEAFEQRPGYGTIVNQLSGALFALTLRCASESADAPRGLLALAQRPRLQPAIAAMFDEPAQPWTLPALAARCHMSRATFVRHFEEALGRSPADVLTEIRMALAGRKLAQTRLSVAEIGEAVGYQSDAAFQRVFKRHVGVTPAQWRAQAKRDAVNEGA